MGNVLGRITASLKRKEEFHEYQQFCDVIVLQILKYCKTLVA